MAEGLTTFTQTELFTTADLEALLNGGADPQAAAQSAYTPTLEQPVVRDVTYATETSVRADDVDLSGLTFITEDRGNRGIVSELAYADSVEAAGRLPIDMRLDAWLDRDKERIATPAEVAAGGVSNAARVQHRNSRIRADESTEVAIDATRYRIPRPTDELLNEELIDGPYLPTLLGLQEGARNAWIHATEGISEQERRRDFLETIHSEIHVPTELDHMLPVIPSLAFSREEREAIATRNARIAAADLAIRIEDERTLTGYNPVKVRRGLLTPDFDDIFEDLFATVNPGDEWDILPLPEQKLAPRPRDAHLSEGMQAVLDRIDEGLRPSRLQNLRETARELRTVGVVASIVGGLMVAGTGLYVRLFDSEGGIGPALEHMFNPGSLFNK
jgi:hypothetical protein